MTANQHHQSNPPPAIQPEDFSIDETVSLTAQMLGGLAPYLSYGVAQHEAMLKAHFIGGVPDKERAMRAAARHVGNVDPTNEAVAAVHSGMMLVAALKSGVHPADAGVLATNVICNLLGLKDLLREPATDY